VNVTGVLDPRLMTNEADFHLLPFLEGAGKLNLPIVLATAERSR